MKVEVDFEDCLRAYVDESKKYMMNGHNDVKSHIQTLLEMVNYEDSINILMDIIEEYSPSIGEKVLEERGYTKEQ